MSNNWEHQPPSNSASYGASNPSSQPPPGYTPPGTGWGAQPFLAPRRRRRVFLVPLIIVLVLCAGGAVVGVAYGLINCNSHLEGTKGNPLAISVGEQPTIMIDGNHATLHITGTPGANQVLVESKAITCSNQPAISYTQSGQTITISLRDADEGEVGLTVPTASNLNITTFTGDIIAENVTGQVLLQSDSGAITATDMTLTGNSTLSNSNGNIIVNNLKGEVMLKSYMGDITATNMTLMGNSTLSNSFGTLTFTGSLTPNGTYVFDNGDGDISVTLPATASFHVDMTTRGAIHSDFPQVTVHRSTGKVPSSDAHGDVGQPPYAQVTISSTSSGNLTLAKG